MEGNLENTAIVRHVDSILLPLIQDSTIAILDAKWLANFQGERLPSRQEFEANHSEAFVSLTGLMDRYSSFTKVELRNMWHSQEHPRSNLSNVFVVSHMWLSQEHPDPNRVTLSIVQRALRAEKRLLWGCGGVFWDYACLYQKPRTVQQEETFRKGLSCIPFLFLHPQITVFQVTKLPVDDQRPMILGHNGKPYLDRGWCFAEHSWSTLTKKIVFDLGAMVDMVDDSTEVEDARSDFVKLWRSQVRSTKGCPLTPELFDECACNLSFSSAKYDYQVVTTLYRASYTEIWRRIGSLDYKGMNWNDSHGQNLIDILKSGSAPNLKRLELGTNLLTSRFCVSLLDICPFTQLQVLDLSYNSIGDEGVCILAPALVRMKRVELTIVGMTAMGCKALAEAFARKQPGTAGHQMEYLALSGNFLGDEGVKMLAPFLAKMKRVMLQTIGMTTDGCKVLAEAFMAEHSPGPLWIQNKAWLNKPPRQMEILSPYGNSIGADDLRLLYPFLLSRGEAVLIPTPPWKQNPTRHH